MLFVHQSLASGRADVLTTLYKNQGKAPISNFLTQRDRQQSIKMLSDECGKDYVPFVLFTIKQTSGSQFEINKQAQELLFIKGRWFFRIVWTHAGSSDTQTGHWSDLEEQYYGEQSVSDMLNHWEDIADVIVTVGPTADHYTTRHNTDRKVRSMLLAIQKAYGQRETGAQVSLVLDTIGGMLDVD